MDLRVDPFELKLAREVERLLFPKSSPVCTWNCIGVKNRTAGMLGGDYFDSITLPDGRLALIVGDVTGPPCVTRPGLRSRKRYDLP